MTRKLLCVVAPLLASCQAFWGGVLGAGAGAATTGTPQGAAAGAAGGFLVGAWDAICAWWKGLWHHEASGVVGVAHSASQSARKELILWVIVLTILAIGLKFAAHFIFDDDFRAHTLSNLKKLVKPKLQRIKKAVDSARNK